MPPTNVLLITCDEMAASAVSCYGNDRVAMPAFDRCAAEGATFVQAHTQVPKCIPTRGLMLTGRYAHTDGLRTMSTRDFSDGSFMLLDKHTPSLLTWLGQAGYRLALAGKNHLVGHAHASELFEPLDQGARPEPPRYAESKPEWTRAYFAGRVSDDYDPDGFRDAVAVDRMIAFLKRAAGGERPFFALCDISEPHAPYKEWPGLADHVALEDVPLPPRPRLEDAPGPIRAWRQAHGIEDLTDDDRRRILRAYWSQCIYADRLVGRLLDALDQLDLARRTLVILCSDHGDFAGQFGCYEKWDTALYDCITRVPLLLRMPGAIPAGHRETSPVEMIDIAPTVLDVLGLETPAGVHGRSLAALLGGRVQPRQAVFSQGGVEPEALSAIGSDYRRKIPACYYGKQETLLSRPEALLRAHMVRTLEHKLIHRLSGDHELYDLKADPYEQNNRYDDPALAEVQRDLRSRLLDFLVRYQNDNPPIEEIWA
jgi:choline-sulfatase